MTQVVHASDLNMRIIRSWFSILAIGPIPISERDFIRKEVITKMVTNMTTKKTFYTDSNGRDFLKRVRDNRTGWLLEVNEPIAGNYYPVKLIDDQEHYCWLSAVFNAFSFI